MNKICVKVKIDAGGFMPTKAHYDDAGFDIYAPDDVKVYSDAIIDTKVRMQIPSGYVGFIKTKSGLAVKRHIQSDTGVIDAGYVGTIAVKLVNLGHTSQEFKKGEKIAQIVILPIPDVELIEADKLDETDRGEDGFGSSGK